MFIWLSLHLPENQKDSFITRREFLASNKQTVLQRTDVRITAPSHEELNMALEVTSSVWLKVFPFDTSRKRAMKHLNCLSYHITDVSLITWPDRVRNLTSNGEEELLKSIRNFVSLYTWIFYNIRVNYNNKQK